MEPATCHQSGTKNFEMISRLLESFVHPWLDNALSDVFCYNLKDCMENCKSANVLHATLFFMDLEP
jgi:hypothetical protein